MNRKLWQLKPRLAYINHPLENRNHKEEGKWQIISFIGFEKRQTSDAKPKAFCPTANAVLIDLYIFISRRLPRLMGE